MRQRYLHLSRERDGLVGVRGALLPDVAAKLQTIIDACLSPKTAPAFLSVEEAMAAGRDADPRSRDQQRHDVFAGIVDTAARALTCRNWVGPPRSWRWRSPRKTWSRTPGAGLSGRPRSRCAAVRQFACTGGMQKIVFDQDGRIIQLGSPERIFTAQQRRAIILRDGECCTPGCHMPGALSEIHHVDPAADGGPTHTDNGMVLCWFHHRILDTSGWAIPNGQRTTRSEIPTLARRHRQPGTPPADPPPSDKPKPTENDDNPPAKTSRFVVVRHSCRGPARDNGRTRPSP